MIMFILVLLGLCFGSFINALVWRLHEQGMPKNKKQKTKTNLSITNGRSMCPNCRHVLAWHDLLPVISWLSLKGRCRYCHRSISLQYPLIEMLTAGLFVLSYIFWPAGFFGTEAYILFGLWLLFLVGFVALAVYDLRWMLLPNKLVTPLLYLAILEVLIKTLVFRGGLNLIIEAVLGFLCVGGLFYVLFQISKGKWIGGGDVKLGFVLGLLVGGPIRALLVLFIASCLGSFAGLGLILIQKTNLKKRIPFGPFLIIATIIVYLFGSVMIAWYKARILLI